MEILKQADGWSVFGHPPETREPPEGLQPGAAAGRRLRSTLIVSDLLSVIAGWGLGWVVQGSEPAFAVLGVVVTIGLIAKSGLFRSRSCTIRVIENTKLAQACVHATAAVAVVSVWSEHETLRLLLVGGATSTVLLLISRAAFRSSLMQARRDGRQLRPVIVVGTNQEARDLLGLMRTNPAFGYVPVGVVGDRQELTESRFGAPWLGEIEDLDEAIATCHASGVVIASGALGSDRLNRVVRHLLDANVHVQLTTGLRGLDQRRLVRQDLAYEPLLYVRPVRLERWQQAAKRITDVVGAMVALVLLSPVLLAAAIAVRVSSPGPVLFRQVRVGRGGQPFTVFKFRTMVDGAAGQLETLREQNERRGPLFKMTDDPRRTAVGRVLERLSIDELPQLVNVVTGDMSLVGPRPALECETEHFDEELMERLTVKPGVTGIWQLEARDDPNFETYRRMDIFYVENWSMSLDLAILIATVVEVTARGCRSLRRGDVAPHPAVAS